MTLVVPFRRRSSERLAAADEALLGAEFVLEHVRGRGEGLVDVAAPQLGIEREIGVLLALEMLEVGEGAGRLQLSCTYVAAVIASTSS